MGLVRLLHWLRPIRDPGRKNQTRADLRGSDLCAAQEAVFFCGRDHVRSWPPSSFLKAATFNRVLKLGSSIARLKNSRVASPVFVFFHADPIGTSPWSPIAHDQLKPDPKYARVHSKKQIRQIAKSIESFGFNVPILVGANLWEGRCRR
jgi:hypothetical protein